MSPGPGERRESPGVFLAGLLVGLTLGALVMGVLGAGAAYVLVQQVERQERLEPTVPVLVANTKWAPGEVVDFKEIAQGRYPKRLQTSSMVDTGSASFVVGQTLLVPVEVGEPVLWGFFELARSSEPVALEECKNGLAQHPGPRPPERTAQAIRARLMGGGTP